MDSWSLIGLFRWRRLCWLSAALWGYGANSACTSLSGGKTSLKADMTPARVHSLELSATMATGIVITAAEEAKNPVANVRRQLLYLTGPLNEIEGTAWVAG